MEKEVLNKNKIINGILYPMTYWILIR